MSMSSLERLVVIKAEITKLLDEAEFLLRKDFPKHHEKAYAFWIPQAYTALGDVDRWLPRGCCTMQKTIDDICNP
jgi:hypothetical protein